MEDKCEDANKIRIMELEKRMNLISSASEQAIKLAANDLKTRLESMNEFRMAMKDQAANFITRKEIESIHEHFSKRQEAQLSFILSIVGILISSFSLFLNIK